jgi:hypothetical protein
LSTAAATGGASDTPQGCERSATISAVQQDVLLNVDTKTPSSPASALVRRQAPELGELAALFDELVLCGHG